MISKAFPKIAKQIKAFNTPVVDLIAVQTKDPFKVLVATILSARTKDETTAPASQRLFDLAGNANELDKLSVKQIEKAIFPVGFYRNKAQHLSKLPGQLNALFEGNIPDNIDDLIKLPGVGRKTANLVVSVAFKKPAICVDTHVHRIVNIWQYVNTKNPLETEMALRKKLPVKYWNQINSLLVAFGQSICRPISPHCDVCSIQSLCKQKGVKPRKVK